MEACNVQKIIMRKRPTSANIYLLKLAIETLGIGMNMLEITIKTPEGGQKGVKYFLYR